jgi:hypothetical protein
VRRREALLGGLAAPAPGFGRVARHRDPVGKHQLAIAVGDVLVDRGGAGVPGGDPAIGLSAMQVGKAQLILRLGMALLGGPPEPDAGITETADNTFAPRVEQTQLKLAFGVAGRRRLDEVAQRLCIFLASRGGEPGADEAAGGAAGDGQRLTRGCREGCQAGCQGSRIASCAPCTAPLMMYIIKERVPICTSAVSVMPGIRRKPPGTLCKSTLVNATRTL